MNLEPDLTGHEQTKGIHTHTKTHALLFDQNQKWKRKPPSPHSHSLITGENSTNWDRDTIFHVLLKWMWWFMWAWISVCLLTIKLPCIHTYKPTRFCSPAHFFFRSISVAVGVMLIALLSSVALRVGELKSARVRMYENATRSPWILITQRCNQPPSGCDSATSHGLPLVQIRATRNLKTWNI